MKRSSEHPEHPAEAGEPMLQEVDLTVTACEGRGPVLPRPADRATQEEEFRPRICAPATGERKSHDSTMSASIEQDDYGFCDAQHGHSIKAAWKPDPPPQPCIDRKTLDEIQVNGGPAEPALPATPQTGPSSLPGRRPLPPACCTIFTGSPRRPGEPPPAARHHRGPWLPRME